MKSGIYKLRFSSGYVYIGKSVDIGERYKQHLEKFSRGTHSKKMQDHYNVWGIPSCEAVTLCHTDHIDLLESIWICYYHKQLGLNMLNTQFPAVDPDYQLLVDHSGLLHYSTAEHLRSLLDYEKKVEVLQSTIHDYRKNGKILPQELSRLKVLESRVLELESYKSLPWYRKIFN